MDKEYIPYGEEWERAMMKRTKKNLIDMVRKIQTIRPKEEVGVDPVYFLINNKLDDLILNDRESTAPKDRVYASDALRKYAQALSQPIRLPGEIDITQDKDAFVIRTGFNVKIQRRHTNLGSETPLSPDEILICKLAQALSDVAGLNKKGE